MFESLQRSWELLTESLSVLARDKRLLLFPVLSAVATILVSLTFLMPLFASGALERLQLRDRLRHGDSATYLVLFLFYYVNYFVVVFFNGALVASAGLYLAGMQPTLNDGLRAAGNRLGRIAYWVFIASTVGLLLRAIRSRTGRAGRFISSLFGVAWSLVTYFIVPVIIFEDRPLFDSIDRSVILFRKAWGEEIGGGIGFGFVWVLAAIPGFFVLFASFRSHSLPGTVLAIFYFLLLATVASAAKGIFTAALYRYAAHADASGGFSADMLRRAFLPDGSGTSLRPASVDTQPAIKASLEDVELISTEDRDTYLIRVQAGAAGYCGSYTVQPSDPGFRPDSWQPGTPLNLRVHGDWLLISGPGSHELWCHFLPDGPAQARQES